MKPVIRILSLAALLAVGISACGTFGGASTPAPVADNPAPTQPIILPTAAPGDPCANEFYPVKANANWLYTSGGSPSGAYQLLNTITEVSPNGFKMTSQFRKKPRRLTWECRSEGLVATQLIADNATNIAAFEKFPIFKISNITGVNIPVTINPGMEWTLDFDVTGSDSRTGGSNASNMTGHIASKYKAGNKESVTVPAGTFDAIPIQVDTLIQFTVQAPTGATTLALKSSYTYWFAAGVGWVKANGSGQLGGLDYFETIQLDSYKIQ